MSEGKLELADGRKIKTYTRRSQVYMDLYEILPDVECNYNTDYRRGKTYSQHEKEVLTPALEAAGFKVRGWYTIDGDSFGPLVRGVETDKGIITYG